MNGDQGGMLRRCASYLCGIRITACQKNPVKWMRCDVKARMRSACFRLGCIIRQVARKMITLEKVQDIRNCLASGDFDFVRDFMPELAEEIDELLDYAEAKLKAEDAQEARMI